MPKGKSKRKPAASSTSSASPLETGQYSQPLPLVSVEGTAAECGRQLGYIWCDSLRLAAARPGRGEVPWWKHKAYAGLLERHCPHLPDFFRGMAQSAGLKEDEVGTRAPADAGGGCTSFALAPGITATGQPISGQTKDNPVHRLFQFLVLRVKMSDAPSMLTLTYPGWLFGHGFVEGGCSIFRNSLWAPWPGRGLPSTVWGLLALHCKTVEDVVKMTRDHGCDMGGHVTVADSHGGIVGMEITAPGLGLIKPRRGIYTHANAICASAKLIRHERQEPMYGRENSLLRQDRLRARLEPERGRLTAATAFAALSDHEGHPAGICRHEGAKASTAAAVVVEPTRGLLHACRGRPCENFPVTYRL